MATLTATNPTLLDVAKRTDPNGTIADIVEILNETNEILQDMTFVEANDGTGHKTTIRTGLPTAAWRKLNYGVPSGKSTTTQVRDTCGMLENYAKVDKALIDMSGDPKGFRLSEDRAFIEGMNQQVADTVFYGDTDVNPERFLGLAPRFDDLSGPANADNIINGGGAANLTSVWLVGWGPRSVHGIFPKGSKAGLTVRDLGEDTQVLADGSEYQIMRTHYKWDLGMTVRDWRHVVRIANVRTDTLTKDASAGADLVDLMTQALELVPQGTSARWAFYGNRTIKSFLRRQIRNANNVQISMEQVAGKHVMMFDGVPVRRCDALLNTEATIS